MLFICYISKGQRIFDEDKNIYIGIGTWKACKFRQRPKVVLYNIIGLNGLLIGIIRYVKLLLVRDSLDLQKMKFCIELIFVLFLYECSMLVTCQK